MKKFSIFITIMILIFAACSAPNNNTINKIYTKEHESKSFSIKSSSKICANVLPMGSISLIGDATHTNDTFEHVCAGYENCNYPHPITGNKPVTYTLPNSSINESSPHKITLTCDTAHGGGYNCGMSGWGTSGGSFFKSRVPNSGSISMKIDWFGNANNYHKASFTGKLTGDTFSVSGSSKYSSQSYGFFPEVHKENIIKAEAKFPERCLTLEIIQADAGNLNGSASIRVIPSMLDTWKVKVSGNDYSESIIGSGTKVLGLPLNTGVEILEDGSYKVEAFYVDDETKKATGDINVRNKIELNKDKSEINLENKEIKFSVIAPNVGWTFEIKGTTSDTIKADGQIEQGSSCSFTKTGSGNSIKPIIFNGICGGKYFKNGGYSAVLKVGKRPTTKTQSFSVNMPEDDVKCKADEVYMASLNRCCAAGQTCTLGGDPPVLVTPKPPLIDPNPDPEPTPIIITTPTPDPSATPTNPPSPSPTPRPTRTPNPNPTSTPSGGNPSPTPSQDFEPFAVYSNIASDDDDLSNEFARAEGLNDNFIASEYGFKVTANAAATTIRTNYELGEGTVHRIASSITLYNRTKTKAEVIGAVSIINISDKKKIVTFPGFSQVVDINIDTNIEKPVNGGSSKVKIPGFKGTFKPGDNTLSKYYWAGRDGAGSAPHFIKAGPNFVKGGNYEVVTEYTVIYPGNHRPLPALNVRAIIDVRNDFPNYTKEIPKIIPLNVQEHIRSKHRLNYISTHTAINDSYTSFINQYDLFDQAKHDPISISVTGFRKALKEIGFDKRSLLGTEYGKGTCFYVDQSNPTDSNQIWTNKVIMQQIKSIANMEDLLDSWTPGHSGTNRIVVTGTRKVGEISHTINVIVDLQTDKIWTGIPIGGSIIKDNQMTSYYYNLPWSEFLSLKLNKGQDLQ